MFQINPSSAPYIRQTAGILKWHVDTPYLCVVLFCGIPHHIYDADKIVIVEDTVINLKIIRNIIGNI